MQKPMLVLGVETSCDETAVALYDSEGGLLGHRVHSQIDIHNDYGGVVPELASRDHVKKLLPLLNSLLSDLNLNKASITGVAYTSGPGLLGALMVGACFARALAMSLQIPAIGVHHLEGHLLAPMLEEQPPQFPFVALLVSGGHTQLICVHEIGQYQLLGQSLDDAVGEAFDKTAKMLGLNYPGGPEIERLARQGVAERFHFPRPMVDRPGLNMSFSGLKTFTRNTVIEFSEDAGLPSRQTCADIALAFQTAVIDTLVIKCRRALQQAGLERLVIAGGVAANQALRERMENALATKGVELFYPRLEFCTDNAAMIAFAGYQRLNRGFSNALSVNIKARWPLNEIEGQLLLNKDVC